MVGSLSVEDLKKPVEVKILGDLQMYLTQAWVDLKVDQSKP